MLFIEKFGILCPKLFLFTLFSIFIIKEKKMDENTIATVFITAITVLGSASAWRFYEKREERKRKWG